jgi:hypothetical protein
MIVLYIERSGRATGMRALRLPETAAGAMTRRRDVRAAPQPATRPDAGPKGTIS